MGLSNWIVIAYNLNSKVQVHSDCSISLAWWLDCTDCSAFRIKTCINTKSSGSDYSLLILMLRVRIPVNFLSDRNNVNFFFSLFNIAVQNYFTHIQPYMFWLRHAPVALLPGKEPRFLLNRRLDGTQSRSGRLGGEKNLFGIRTPDRPARILVTVPT